MAVNQDLDDSIVSFKFGVVDICTKMLLSLIVFVDVNHLSLGDINFTNFAAADNMHAYNRHFLEQNITRICFCQLKLFEKHISSFL